jgi:hypothetical protein
MTIAIDNSKPADRFAETKKQMDADAAKLAALKARLGRAEAGLVTANDTVKEAVAALADVALQRADGVEISGAAAKRRVSDAKAEAEAAAAAVEIAKADVDAGEGVAVESALVHSHWATAKAYRALGGEIRKLGSIGRSFESQLVTTQKAVLDLAETQRDARREQVRRNPLMARQSFAPDDALARLDRLVGIGLSGATMNLVRENMPNHVDADELASRQDAEADRLVRNL